MVRTTNTPTAHADPASRLRSAFPRSLSNDLDAALNVIPNAPFHPSENVIGPVSIAGERLVIPCRIYSAEPDRHSIYALGDTPRVMLACIFTRHHNGFVRQKYLETLLLRKELWIPPFVLQLVGEYVIEIIDVIARHIEALRSDSYSQFIAENHDFIALTKRRIISYWDCYYRLTYPRFRDYVGFQVIDSLNLWRVHDAGRLISR